MRGIAEKDWKRLRAKQEKKLNQASENIVGRVKAALQDQQSGHYNIYLAIWDIIHEGDAGIVEMFDDLKRSTAVFKLAAWHRHGLLSEDELKEFSDETQAIIRSINE